MLAITALLDPTIEMCVEVACVTSRPKHRIVGAQSYNALSVHKMLPPWSPGSLGVCGYQNPAADLHRAWGIGSK